MEDCWKPEDEISHDLACRIAGALDELKVSASYNRKTGTISTWFDKDVPVRQLTKHEALDVLLDAAEKVIGVLDEARKDVDKATLIGMMRSTLASDTPPDEIDYGMIAVTEEDLESAARTMKLGHHEKAALLRRREQIAWAVANNIMTEKFMEVVVEESKNTLAEIARLN